MDARDVATVRVRGLGVQVELVAMGRLRRRQPRDVSRVIRQGLRVELDDREVGHAGLVGPIAATASR